MNMKPTDLTLLDQLHMDDAEISRRMELLRFGTEEMELLADCHDIIEQQLDLIVEDFYAIQTADEEKTLLIGDAETLSRLKREQARYILELFSGLYDTRYVETRLRIGMVHKRIGVEPKLYLSSVKILRDLIVATLRSAIEDVGRREHVTNALDKLINFDVTLVFDTYIDSLLKEVMVAQRRTEQYATSLEDKISERTRQLEQQAKLDPLTNLYNRRAMRELLVREVKVARRHHRELSLVYLDVDDFKQINDRFGHVKGDEVLIQLADSMNSVIREVDIACRYGGDEFCLILPECDLNNACSICAKIIEAFRARCDHCTLSIGIAATGPDHPQNADDLIEHADRLMYGAKQTQGFQVRTS